MCGLSQLIKRLQLSKRTCACWEPLKRYRRERGNTQVLYSVFLEHANKCCRLLWLLKK